MTDNNQPVPSPGDAPTETLHAADLPPGGPLLPRGARVGRYLILHEVGQGGMGVVYAGFDPELERKVALKLLRPDRIGGEAARLRLLREAQAIARLAHPNVVAVYDAGSLGDRVFIAMELVPGPTLRQWLETEKRPWREVVDRFLAAGRGLAAAHLAGLVHRDFKPENVLLGDDGRVRVVDFGLARPALPELPEAPAASDAGAAESPSYLSARVTEHGKVLGTPAYMAPEQFAGAPADARSDQYSFCVALWEALCGARPGADPGREIPAGLRMLPWLRQALLRGLSEAPEARHGSMAELLTVLARDPWARGRRWLTAAVLLVLAGAAGLGWARFRERRVLLCAGGESRVAELWNAPRKKAIETAFTAAGATYAAKSWAAVERSLGGFFSAWSAMHRESCEATRVRGEQSEDLLDRRMACLDERLRQAAALTEVFVHADRKIVERAVGAASGLGVEDCADTAALTARVPLPRDPASREKIRLAQDRLARAQALSDAGREQEALQAVDFPATGFRPLNAETLYLKGYLQGRLGRSREAEATLFDSLLAAQAGGHRKVIGLAGAELARVVGYDEGRHEEGRRWIRLAQSAIEGMKGSAALQVRLLTSLGPVLRREGLYDQEEATYRQALALAERELGPQSRQAADALASLGTVLNVVGRQEESLQASSRALAIRRRILDPRHPDIGRVYNTLGNALFDLARRDEGLVMYQKALQVFAASYGAEHPVTAGVDANVGIMLKDQGRFEEALQHYRRYLAATQASAPDGPGTAMVLSNLGEVYLIQKKYSAALPEYERAVALEEKLLGPDHPDRAYAIKGVGEALLGLGRARESVPFFERALALREAGKVPLELVANSRFSLGKALWEAGDRERALQLVRRASADYGKAVGGNSREMGEEVKQWLASRGTQR